jgi:phosphoenolpyruvate synthase/pyruvate phosphate dikinase
MISRLHDAGIRVPEGFATTADAYWRLLGANDLVRAAIHSISVSPDGFAEVKTTSPRRSGSLVVSACPVRADAVPAMDHQVEIRMQ